MINKSSPTYENLLAQAASHIGGDTPRLDAELLLSHVTGLGRASFRAWPERGVSADQAAAFEELVAERAGGKPVAYLLGHQEFWSLSLCVSASTLIPRPDTECLVETALSLPLPTSAKVLDMGTGTGAIALALASERTGWHVTACDCVADAVSLAQRNASELGLPVVVLNSSWFSDIEPQSFTLIVSNPPYIAAQDHHLDEGDVRFEPLSALVSGTDGLDDLRLIIDQAPAWLENDGWLLVEHGFDQAEAVNRLFKKRGFVAVEGRKDYGHRDRITLGQWTHPGSLEMRNAGDQNAQ